MKMVGFVKEKGRLDYNVLFYPNPLAGKVSKKTLLEMLYIIRCKYVHAFPFKALLCLLTFHNVTSLC